MTLNHNYGCFSGVGSGIAGNGWVYEQVCLAEMFNFSTNVIGKLAYSTCYNQCGLLTQNLNSSKN